MLFQFQQLPQLVVASWIGGKYVGGDIAFCLVSCPKSGQAENVPEDKNVYSALGVVGSSEVRKSTTVPSWGVY